jgi:hypothetical protein
MSFHLLIHQAAIKSTLVEAVGKAMKLAEDAETALNGNDPNVNELKGWFFADYRLDLVKGDSLTDPAYIEITDHDHPGRYLQERSRVQELEKC